MSKLTIFFRLVTTCTVVIFFSPSISSGQDIEGARVLGLGSAFTAIADDTAAVRANPAGIALNKVYILSLSSTKIKDGASAYNATIVDYQTTEMPVGISYTRKTTADIRMDYGIISFAERYGNLLIGISGKYFSQESNTKEKDYSYDAGILIRGSNNLSIGFVAKNLDKTKFSFIHKEYIVGIAFSPKDIFKLSYDYTKDRDAIEKDYISAAGIEVALRKDVIIRGGYIDNSINSTEYYSAGLTLASPTMKLEYGYRWNKNKKGDNRQALSIQVKL